MSDFVSFGINGASGVALWGPSAPQQRNTRAESADRVVKPAVSGPPTARANRGHEPDADTLQKAADASAERDAFIADLRARLGAPVASVEPVPDSAALARSRENASAKRAAQAYGWSRAEDTKGPSPSYVPRRRSTDDDQRI